jgi:hypothetical protein
MEVLHIEKKGHLQTILKHFHLYTIVAQKQQMSGMVADTNT